MRILNNLNNLQENVSKRTRKGAIFTKRGLKVVAKMSEYTPLPDAVQYIQFSLSFILSIYFISVYFISL